MTGWDAIKSKEKEINLQRAKTLFIDPGIAVGWVLENEGKSVESGAFRLEGKSQGERVLEFYQWLQAMPDLDMVAWEEAAFSRFHTASRMYGTWEGLLILFCEKRGISYMAVNQSSIKCYARKHGFIEEVKGVKKSKKPLPRPEWVLTSVPKLNEHEIDARWGMEYFQSLLKKEKK